MRKRMVATDVLLVKQHLSALGLPTIKAECEQAESYRLKEARRRQSGQRRNRGEEGGAATPDSRE